MPERITHNFGEFSLDPARRVLTRAGVEVALTGKEFEVLLYLVEKCPHPCSHDELIENVWGTNVENNAVERVITRVRAALSDSPRTPRFIKTVRGKGYAFIGDVATAEFADKEPAEATSDPDADPAPSRGTSSRGYVTLVSIIIVVSVTAVAMLLYRRSDAWIAGIGHHRLFFDDFTADKVDAEKWHTSGNGVHVENGIVHVECLETDNCGRLASEFFRIDRTKPIIVRSRIFIHCSDNIKGQSYLLGFFGLTMKRPGMDTDYVGEDTLVRDVSIHGVYYANYDVEVRDKDGNLTEIPTEGWFLFRNGGSPARKEHYAVGKVSQRLTPYWDQWITQVYRWDPQSGYASLSVDGKDLGTFNVGPLPDDLIDDSLRIEVAPRGWWLYHRFDLDSIEVLQ
jgi:DNA-binding winged helix-turn-helix (wHTH) protein